ncbi:MAG: S8 family serine peptidase, partial [Chloroflexi bacterium]|nr:S8 family serine peptidase [Chloroflexota bacterium]
MRKELFLGLVSVVLIIAAAIAACQQAAMPAAPVSPATVTAQPRSPLVTPPATVAPAETPLPSAAVAVSPSPSPVPAISLPTVSGGPSPAATLPPGVTPVLPAPTPPGPPTISRGEWEKIALKYVSEKHAVPLDQLSIASFNRDVFPLINKAVAWGIVLWARGNARTFVVGVDQDGNTLEEPAISKFRDLEQAAVTAKYGKLDPRLGDLLQNKGPDETVDVIISVVGNRSPEEIWAMIAARYPEAHMTSGGNTTKDTPLDFYLKVVRPDFFREQRADIAKATAPLIEYLADRGYPARPGSFLPTVIAVLPKKIILELQQRNDVLHIDGPSDPRPGLDTATPSTGAPSAWGWGRDGSGRPITGEGVSVGILETWGFTVDFDNPYLRGSVVGPPDKSSTHPTKVAGAAASSHPKYRGPAYKSTILSAGFNGNGYGPASDLLVGAGALVINHSWGEWSDGFGQMERTFDWLTRYGRIANVAIAGNEGDWVVRSPGKGYNVITVGSFDDKSTVPWRGDTMSSFSSWQNSSDKRNEKPELAAPGSTIITTTIKGDPEDLNASYIVGDLPDEALYITGGTSFAAPQVTAGVAMLFQKTPVLIEKPEAVKAILMASAIHNIQGDPALVEDPGGTNRDGAGAISLAEAYNVVKDPASPWREFAAINLTTDFDADGWYKSSPNIVLKKEERLRVATAWDSAVGPVYSWDNFLRTHLDLFLYRLPDEANPVSSSVSLNDSVRVIDFYDPAGPAEASYKIKIKKSSSNEALENTNNLGLAWWKGSRYYAATSLQQEVWIPGTIGSPPVRSVVIDDVTEPRVPSSENQSASVPGGVKYYRTELTYPPASPTHPAIVVLGAYGNGIEGSPFDYPPPTAEINNPEGKTTVYATASSPGAQAPVKLARIFLRLDGSARESHELYQYFDSIQAFTGNEAVASQTAVRRQFQRG